MPPAEERAVLRRFAEYAEISTGLTLGAIDVQPDRPQVPKRGIERGAYIAGLAEEHTAGFEEVVEARDDAPPNGQAVRAAIEAVPRFVAELGRCRVQFRGRHIRRVAHDQVVAAAGETFEKVGRHQFSTVRDSRALDVGRGSA